MKTNNSSIPNHAGISEYSMIIDRSELDYWTEKGWVEKEFKKLEGRKKQIAQLFSDYPEDHETIIECRPVLLKVYDWSQLIGRRIWGYSTQLVDYGMGGPGFFGLLLDNLEYLTYAVYGAGHYVLVDGRAVECNYELYDRYKPLYSNFGGRESWDLLRKIINGSSINDYHTEKHQLTLTLRKKKVVHTLQFVRYSPLIPRKVGKFPNAYKQGVISDYLVFQHKNATLYVYLKTEK